MTETEILARLKELRIVPVIVIEDAADAEPLGAALAGGGLPCAEITFRTKAAGEAIRRIADAHPDLLVGAGTVLTPKQAAEAKDAGAKFVVSPGFNPAVVDACREHGVPVFPGVCTPTEIEAALAKELSVLKFFPAEPAGGLSFLKAIAAPYSMVSFIPTGGINAANVGDYLAFKAVVACGGSWMAPSGWIAGRQFDRIRDEVAAAVKASR
jgi:2-dehydro-3-deoxyphosphogluconate aldolase/(4S)-4-hydroxy-2-oxoglutarate aldolase